MTIQVSIPSNLRQHTERRSIIEVDAPDVSEALKLLVDQYPELRPRLFSEDARLHSFVNLFVGSRSIRELEGLGTRLSDGDTLLIVPALAGG